MKKYNGTEWVDTTLRQYKTATDTLTTLPADIYADGNNATVGLKGNTVQNGTPTPSNPVEVQGVGVRTSNLWGDVLLTNIYIDGEGNSGTAANGDIFELKGLTVSPETLYTFSWSDVVSGSENNKPYIRICFYTSNGGSFISRLLVRPENYPDKYITFTIPINCSYVDIRIDSETSTRGQHFVNLMLTVGSTAKPHEPYGYKIPISSANTTTPVYLGEAESTRKIKKLVLTGEESYDYQSQYSRYVFTVMDAFAEDTRKTQCFCSHYQSVHNGEPIDDVPNNSIYINQQQAGTQFCIKTESITSAADFKTYLAQQYAAGTPVCVWYVLATETTGIANEPIRKIGDYADTVSGITIPTIAGANSFDVLTTLKPSEVELTYTGWHDASVGEWDGSEWQ